MKFVSNKILVLLLSASFGLGVSSAYAQDAFSIREVSRETFVSIVVKNAAGWTLIDDSGSSSNTDVQLRQIGTKLISPSGVVLDVADILIKREEQIIGIGNQGEIFFYSKTDQGSESNFVISKVTLEDREKTVLYQFSIKKSEHVDQIVGNGAGQFAIVVREQNGKVDGSANLLIMDKGALNVVQILPASKKLTYHHVYLVINDEGRIIVQVVTDRRIKNRNVPRLPSSLIFSGSFSENAVTLVGTPTARAVNGSGNSIKQMVGDTLWIGGFNEFLVDVKTFKVIPSTVFRGSNYTTYIGSMGVGAEAPFMEFRRNRPGLVVISPNAGVKRYRCPLFEMSDAIVDQVWATNFGKILTIIESEKQQKLIELSPIENSQTKPADEIGRCLQVK